MSTRGKFLLSAFGAINASVGGSTARRYCGQPASDTGGASEGRASALTLRSREGHGASPRKKAVCESRSAPTTIDTRSRICEAVCRAPCVSATLATICSPRPLSRYPSLHLALVTVALTGGSLFLPRTRNFWCEVSRRAS